MKKLHWYYKFLIVFIILFSMFFLLNKNMSKIVNSSPYKSYIDIISIPFDFLDKYNIFRYKQVLKENENLKKHIIITTTENYQKEELINELNTLKETLNLKNTYTTNNVEIAKVITRNKMYWFNTITIDKGTENGLKEGEAVVTQNGLIGQIKYANKTTSKVKLITSNEDSKISVTIKTNQESLVGNIIGYQNPYTLVELPKTTKKPKKGDIVKTSGLGNLPKNISIGIVDKIKKDDYKISYILYITPSQNMNDLTYVGVLTNK